MCDYLYRLTVILQPNIDKDKKYYLIKQAGIEYRLGRGFGDYEPFCDFKAFWTREVTVVTHHQRTLKYLEDLVLYLLTLNFVEWEVVEFQVRSTLLRSTQSPVWSAHKKNVHEVIQNPQRITRTQSFP